MMCCNKINTGCKFPTSPTDSQLQMTLTIAANIRNLNTAAFLQTTLTVHGESRLYMRPTTIIYREQQYSTNSDCHIDSLEVYRGRHHTAVISHAGFSITNEGTIEV